jgi:hypothetical protein
MIKDTFSRWVGDDVSDRNLPSFSKLRSGTVEVPFDTIRFNFSTDKNEEQSIDHRLEYSSIQHTIQNRN